MKNCCDAPNKRVSWMWSQNELVKLLIEHQQKLIRLLGAHERKVDAPPPEPPEPAPRPKFKSGTQEWYRQLPPPKTNDGVSMNKLARSVPKPRPPRKPSWER